MRAAKTNLTAKPSAKVLKRLRQRLHMLNGLRQDKMNAAGGHFQFQLKPAIGGGQAFATCLLCLRSSLATGW